MLRAPDAGFEHTDTLWTGPHMYGGGTTRFGEAWGVDGAEHAGAEMRKGVGEAHDRHSHWTMEDSEAPFSVRLRPTAVLVAFRARLPRFRRSHPGGMSGRWLIRKGPNLIRALRVMYNAEEAALSAARTSFSDVARLIIYGKWTRADPGV